MRAQQNYIGVQAQNDVGVRAAQISVPVQWHWDVNAVSVVTSKV